MAKALHFQVCLRIVAPHTSCARIPQTWDRTPYWNSWAAPIQIPRQGRRSIPSNRPSLTGQRVCISTMYWCIYGSKIIIIYNRWTYIYIPKQKRIWYIKQNIVHDFWTRIRSNILLLRETEAYSSKPIDAQGHRLEVPAFMDVHEAHLMAKNDKNRPNLHFSRQATANLTGSTNGWKTILYTVITLTRLSIKKTEFTLQSFKSIDGQRKTWWRQDIHRVAPVVLGKADLFTIKEIQTPCSASTELHAPRKVAPSGIELQDVVGLRATVFWAPKRHPKYRVQSILLPVRPLIYSGFHATPYQSRSAKQIAYIIIYIMRRFHSPHYPPQYTSINKPWATSSMERFDDHRTQRMQAAKTSEARALNDQRGLIDETKWQYIASRYIIQISWFICTHSDSYLWTLED